MRIRSWSADTLLLLGACALVATAAVAGPAKRDSPTAGSATPATLVARADGQAVPALPAVESEEKEEFGVDWIPHDPSEDRPQLLPPPRPDERSVTAGGVWVGRGPAPTFGGQVIVPPDNEVSGAVQAIAAHPTNANIVYLGKARVHFADQD